MRMRAWWLWGVVLYYGPVRSVSMVYNFRIAQITKQPIVDEQEHTGHTLINLLFDQYVKHRRGSAENFVGLLEAYMCTYHAWYVRVDMAVAGIQEASASGCTRYSGANFDDILITAGRNFSRGNSVMTWSLLWGIPTHQPHLLIHPDLGYGLVGLGMQLDGMQRFGVQGDLVYGFRYIGFTPRVQHYSGMSREVTEGNFFDVLVAYKNNWGLHGWEAGYTARWRTGGAVVMQARSQELPDFVRNNFYSVYKYKFMLGSLHNRFLLNLAVGFDSGGPKNFGAKYLTTCWASWNIQF